VVDLDVLVTEALAGLRLCKTDGADLRVRKDDCGDVVIREFGIFELGTAEEAVAELAAGSDSNCCYILIRMFPQ
jgi:hypothetical protein